MSLFNSETHQQVWIGHHCERCYFGRADTLCPVLHRALRSGRKPVEWERNTRKGALMAETMKCHMETRTAPKRGVERVVADETMSMFDVTPTGRMDSDHA